MIRFALVAPHIGFEHTVGESEFLFAGFAELADPDISEADRVTMVLQ